MGVTCGCVLLGGWSGQLSVPVHQFEQQHQVCSPLARNAVLKWSTSGVVRGFKMALTTYHVA